MIEFRVLGSLDLKGPEGEEVLSVLSQPKRVALLAYLAVATPRGFHRRDKLLGLFWPDLDQDRARAALRKSLHHLRQSLGDDTVLSRGDEEVSLNGDEVWCDVVEFEAALDGEASERPSETEGPGSRLEPGGDAVSEARTLRGELGSGGVERALELYRGDLLEGFFLPGCPEFDRWLEGERERLRVAASGAGWELAHRRLSEGRINEGEKTAQWALDLVPTDESEARRFIKALAAAGDRAAAVRFHERFAQRLAEELDLRPDAESRDLIEKIRASMQVPVQGQSDRSSREPGRDRRSAASPPPSPPPDAPPEETNEDPQPVGLESALADQYAIQREIGRGGMATVYLAEDMKHHRKVAVKVLTPDLGAAVGTERFLREIETAANLTHPHILPLHDSGEADGFLYYVMPYVEGESLRARLNREKQLPVQDAVQIAREVADALAYAHKRGVIHRDVKPANILLEAGHALLADFGVAQAVAEADETRLTRTGVSLGTPAYMSPEQTTGERELDGRSDQYALGCVLYEMLAGQPPFTGAQVESVVRQHLTADPAPVTQTRPSVPAGVARALERALAKSPADRFATAAEFAGAIAGTETDVRALVTPVRWRRTIALPLPLAVGLASLLAAAGAIVGRSALLPAPQGTGAVSRWVVSTSAEHQLAPPNGPQYRERIRLSPDGSRLAYIGGSEPRRLFIRDLDGLDVRPVPGTDGAYSLFFSPDGEWVAFATKTRGGGQHALKKARLPDGPVVTVAPLPDMAVQGAGGGTWGVSDTIIFGLGAYGLMKVPASGGEPESALPTDTAREGIFRHRYPHLLQEDRALLFTTGPRPIGAAADSVWILESGSSDPRFLTLGRDARYLPTGHLVFAQAEDGVVAVVPFDVDALVLAGEPVPVGEDIHPADAYGDFSISENGTLAYIPNRGGDERLVIVDRSGKEVGSWELRGDFYSPRYSNDGDRIAVTGDLRPSGSPTFWLGREWRVWVSSADAAPMPLTSGYQDLWPAWAPDDSRLMFNYWERNGLRRRGIAWAASDGSGQVEYLLLGRGFEDWSSDGQYVSFGFAEYEGPTRHDIGFMAWGGDRTPRMYLQTAFPEYGSKFSPNGRFLAYVSEASGRPDVYVSTFPDATGGTWPITLEGGQEPIWGKDGRELFYWVGQRLMVRSVDTSGGFSMGTPRILFEGDFKRYAYGHMYDVHPDGDRFVMIEPPQSEDIVVVLNFFEVVKEKSGR